VFVTRPCKKQGKVTLLASKRTLCRLLLLLLLLLLRTDDKDDKDDDDEQLKPDLLH
jgi:hypothetical protein